jgi:hypothetical protein
MKTTDRSRYNLHYKARKKGYCIDTKTRTVFVSQYDKNMSIQVKRLRDEFYYAIQLEF